MIRKSTLISFLIAIILAPCALSPDASTSMQRDIAAGKQSEIDGLIYEVVRLADKYGLSLSAYRKISEKFRLDGLK